MASTSTRTGWSLERLIAYASRRSTWFRFVVTVIYGLPIMTFTLPGRMSPSELVFMDPLAKVKVCVLAFTVFGGVGLLWVNRARRDYQFAFGILAPYFVFLGWAITTVLWSPLKAFSLGQAGGLCALLFLSAIVAVLCHDKLYTSRILKHLCYCLNLFAALILAVYCVNPEASGLDRTILLSGGDGLVHPTASGASASLGLLLTTLCLMIGRFPWARRAMWISLVVNGMLLILSNSRSATLMAGITIPLAWYLFSSLRGRGTAMLLLAGLSIGYLVVDPGFSALQESIDSGLQYLSRGQNSDQLRAVSGRAEMWSAVWSEYRHARFLGHGYFVTSPSGKLFVWNVASNHTAHNIYLQILVSTGLVGFVLFLVVIFRLVTQIISLRRGDLFSRHVLWMLGFAGLWYLGWSIGCISFMGPVRPESVVFFTLLGIGIGQLNRLRELRGVPIKGAT